MAEKSHPLPPSPFGDGLPLIGNYSGQYLGSAYKDRLALLQTTLMAAGENVPFGDDQAERDATLKAVKNFKKTHGIKNSDGGIDHETWEELARSAGLGDMNRSKLVEETAKLAMDSPKETQQKFGAVLVQEAQEKEQIKAAHSVEMLSQWGPKFNKYNDSLVAAQNGNKEAVDAAKLAEKDYEKYLNQLHDEKIGKPEEVLQARNNLRDTAKQLDTIQINPNAPVIDAKVAAPVPAPTVTAKKAEPEKTVAKNQPGHEHVKDKGQKTVADNFPHMSEEEARGKQQMMAYLHKNPNAKDKTFGELGDGVDGKWKEVSQATFKANFKDENDLRKQFVTQYNIDNPGHEIPTGTRPEEFALNIHKTQLSAHLEGQKKDLVGKVEVTGDKSLLSALTGNENFVAPADHNFGSFNLSGGQKFSFSHVAHGNAYTDDPQQHGGQQNTLSTSLDVAADLKKFSATNGVNLGHGAHQSVLPDSQAIFSKENIAKAMLAAKTKEV